MINRLGATCSVLVCGFALLGACSSDKPGGFVAPGDDGGSSATGNRAGSGSGRAGGGGKGGSSGIGGVGGADSSELAPVVKITYPAAVTDPNAGPVLIDDEVTVLCSAKPSAVAGSKQVDPSSVKLELFDAEGNSMKSVAGATTMNDSEYSATFVVSALPSGLVSFGCSASDTATPSHAASVTLETLLDRGPEITIGEPADKSPHNLLGPMNVEFTVAALPIAPGDKQANVTGVSLLVGGIEVPVIEEPKGTYRTSVDFTDKTLFNSAPSGSVPVVITASNARKKPGKATHTLAYGILVDAVGPVIAITNPGVGAVVGPASVLSFTIADADSGVDRPTVAVKLNEETKAFSATDNQWTWDATGAYTFKIGAALASATDTQVTVAVLAKDRAGNASLGNTRVYNLDNKPPVVDLDPPAVYEVRPGTAANTLQCSDLFDPLGAFDNSIPLSGVNGSPDDKSTVVNFGRFRALVWDQTNTKAGAGETYLALTDKESVRLYVQPNTDSPLLVDENKDGTCDEILTGSPPHQLNPTDKPLTFLKLIAVSPTVSASPVWGGPNPPPLSSCSPGASVGFTRLCGSPGISDMSVVIRHPVSAQPFEPVIYAVEPDSNPLSDICTGKRWDVSAAISKAEGQATPKLGWVCIAARAVDNVGNHGVSTPLRVCLDDGTNPDRCKNEPPPSCTDGCTPPPHFSPAGPVKHN